MKTVEELKNSLEGILGEGLNIRVYLGVGKSPDREYLRADVSPEDAVVLCEQFVSSLRRYFDNEDLETFELSRLDERANALYAYDLDEQPEEFGAIRELHDGNEPALFTFQGRAVSDVKALVVKISSPRTSATFYKQVFPVSIVRREQILLSWRTNRFEILNEDVLKILPGFDVMLMDDEFYVSSLPRFEKEFAFERVAKKAMEDVVQMVFAMAMVDDVKGYLANLDLAKKHVLRAKHSPAFEMESQAIIAFVENHPTYGLRVADGKIQLRSKSSVRYLFKLLNEDILKSELTQTVYDARAKDLFEPPEEGAA
ncbi:anti-phage protein KwaB [Variovorax sp. RCC_210]|uniref:anti-phage protein KwaB n=1 Tax=Variovorax sp. RCC_210 TaxID=3239217 RepID=UPI003524892E